MADDDEIENLGQTTQGQPVTIDMIFQKADRVNGDPAKDYLVNADPLGEIGVVYSDNQHHQTRHVYPNGIERIDVGHYQCAITFTTPGDFRGANYSTNFDSRSQWVVHVISDPNYP